MAVGTVSGVDQQDNWQLISSTTASGTSMTLTGFTGYKHLWIVGKDITKSASDFPAIRPNNDTSLGSYALGMYAANKFLLAQQSSTALGFSGKIYDIDKTIPHRVEWGFDPAAWGLPQDCYVNPVAITSVVLTTNGGSVTYTGGTVYVYGIPA